MKLSVILVSYNEKEFLSQAVESCLNQTFQDFEIVIGDDGSNDGSIELIDEYAKKYPEKIKYFVMERNNPKDIIPSLRVSAMIKRAVSMISGEYVNLLSGDDYFCDNEKFAKQVSFLENDKNYFASMCDFQRIYPDRHYDNYTYIGGANSFWSMKYVHISSFVFKKDVFNSKYFLKHFCDDTGLLFSILCFGKVHYEPFIGFSYRQREKSIMHEADMLELYLLELLLMQDCLDVKKMRSASLSRFFRPLKHCYRNKSELTNIRYKKYIDFGLGNSNIAITPLVNWNEISMASKFSFYMFYVTAIFSYIFFKVVRKTEWLLLSGGRK